MICPNNILFHFLETQHQEVLEEPATPTYIS